jgi:tetratricopeptide (TPR) repeat protein
MKEVVKQGDISDAMLRRRMESLKDSDPEKAGLLFQLASRQVNRDRSDQAMESFRHCRQLALAAGDAPIACRAMVAMGYLYTRIGEYATAVSCFMQSVDRLHEIGDSGLSGATWLAIGGIHENMTDTLRATESYQRSINCFRESGNRLGEVEAMVKLASLRGRTGPLASSLAELLRILVIYDELGLKDKIAAVLLEIGRLYRRHNETNQALAYLEMARTRAREGGALALEAEVMLCIARLHVTEGRRGEALQLIEQTLAIAADIDNPHLAASLHEIAASASEAEGDLVNALKHNKMFMKYHHDGQRTNQQQLFIELSTRLSLQQTERELLKLDSRTRELQIQMAEKEKENIKLGLRLVQNGNMVEKLRDRHSRSREVSGSAASILTPDGAADDRIAEGMWQIFNQQMDQEHRDFLRALATQHPSITQTELRICSLMRAGLSTKDIAATLYVSVRDIQNHRYRLRKKLGLSAETSLAGYLASL